MNKAADGASQLPLLPVSGILIEFGGNHFVVARSLAGAIHPFTAVVLLGRQVQPQPLLERSRERAMHRVRQPAGRLHDLSDRRALLR